MSLPSASTLARAGVAALFAGLTIDALRVGPTPPDHGVERPGAQRQSESEAAGEAASEDVATATEEVMAQ